MAEVSLTLDGTWMEGLARCLINTVFRPWLVPRQNNVCTPHQLTEGFVLSMAIAPDDLRTHYPPHVRIAMVLDNSLVTSN